MKLNCERLESRDCPSILGSAGASVYELSPAGSKLLFTPFEATFDGPVHLAQDGGLLYVGAGIGGGDRVQVRDAQTFAVVNDFFITDGKTRAGVDLAVFNSFAAPAPDRAPLVATAHPSAPGNPAAVQAQIDALPDGVNRWLTAHGVRVQVYAGPGVTVLPEFAYLRGVHLSDGRTWDTVDAAFMVSANSVFVRENVQRTVPHELGHAVEAQLTRLEQERWVAIHAGIDWNTFPVGSASVDYFRYSEKEAFAESFSLLMTTGGTSLPPAVRDYLHALAASYHWYS